VRFAGWLVPLGQPGPEDVAGGVEVGVGVMAAGLTSELRLAEAVGCLGVAALPAPLRAVTGVDCDGSTRRSRHPNVSATHLIFPGYLGRSPTMMADMEEVEVVVAHHERMTVRVGDVFLKIDADQTRTDVEVAAMAMAPVPTPEILWRKPPVLALAAVAGTALGRFGERSTASAAAWAAAGASVRLLHDAPLPPWPGRSLADFASRLDVECEWLVANDVLPTDVVTRNHRVAEAALRPWTPVFIHGDLQDSHVFVDGDEVTGIIDWSEASQGDALFDLAKLTLGHEEHLDDVVAGYGVDVDIDVIRSWWSLRCLLGVRWLIEHGFDPWPEVALLRSQP
jgi:aminoglycoside phosphotransferase (APT) family kinase protein